MAQPSDDLLRPALEFAFAVAVFGARQRPPIPSPSGLKPFLKLQKLPTAALAPVRRAVDDDSAFRERIAAAATSDLVGSAGMLWLTRPEGWEEALAAEVAADAAAAAAAKDAAAAGAGKAAAKRLAAAEQVARRASAELAVARTELERLRARHQAVAAEEPRQRQRADELERGLERAKGKAERAQQELDEARAGRVAAEARIAELEAELVVFRQAVDRLGAEAAREPATPAPAIPPDAVRGLREAVAATSALTEVLARVADALAPPASDAAADQAAPPAARKTNGAKATAAARRRALRLPGGLTEESTEGAAYLLTKSGAQVLVDGYNVAKLGWPSEPLAQQRDRLLGLLDDLASRSGAQIRVVFDGADVGPIPPGVRRRVLVQFSPPGVIADDELRRLVGTLPVATPVVAATNDRELADSLRRMGANVVTSDQLLAVARR
jgi:predicted RNA-binding protein with PIN domain